jgi:hypothetical protein
MDDSEIQQRVNELDAVVTKDDAKLLIYVEDGEEGACEIIGNRKGYLRAGIEMLRAAVIPLREAQFIVPIDFKYLGSQRSLFVKRLIRQQDVEQALPVLRPTTWKQTTFAYCCLAAFGFLLICTFTGFSDVIRWFFRK